MTKPVILPPICITQGVEYTQRYNLSNSAGALDLTGWTGTLSLSKRPFETPFYTGAVTLGGVAGTVDVTVPVASTLLFEVDPILGGSPVAVQQIYLVAPDQTQNQVWQGPVKIAGKFA
jgi:hypothetical protein